MNPKVLCLISVRNRSGRLVISRPASRILPELGLAMHPIKVRRVVFPEPLGPLRTVTLLKSIDKLIPSMATNSLGFPWLKTLRMLISSIMVMAIVSVSVFSDSEYSATLL